MNEPLLTFLNLLADLLASEINKETNQGKNTESCDRPSPPPARENVPTPAKSMGTGGPIPKFPKHCHPPSHPIPKDIPTPTANQKGDNL